MSGIVGALKRDWDELMNYDASVVDMFISAGHPWHAKAYVIGIWQIRALPVYAAILFGVFW